MLVLNFLESVVHTEFDDLGRIGAASGEAFEEFFVVGGHDEEVDERPLD